MTTSVLWFRRDLRLADHPALAAAARSGDVVPLFVLDPRLLSTGSARTGRLLASLINLRRATGNVLVIRTGDPAAVVSEVAAEVSAETVHVSAETTPYGRRRDAIVAAHLDRAGRALVAAGSPYAVTPGRILNRAGEPYRIFTPFLRAWREHRWPAPACVPEVSWRSGVRSEELPAGATSVPAGEQDALARWDSFRENELPGYADRRDRPDLDSTSRMSIPLKYGEIHPRTLLADLEPGDGRVDQASTERFRTELAWRDFYADVLWHSPGSAWQDWRRDLSAMRYDDDPELLEAWQRGHTGYPFVDAGMRQLLGEGWMHNRVRMVTASFLVKDLHLWWPAGARHFLTHLIDGDLASNNHGWQWVAGTGTDAAPYFRIFNPVTQGLRFDPDGDYVRRWVPELRHLSGSAAHEPWRHPDGYAAGYPSRIVDHAEERREARPRLDQTRHHRASPQRTPQTGQDGS